MKISNIRLLSIGAMLLAGTLSAQERELSLSQAIDYALQNKADAQKAKWDIKNAEAKITEVKAGALPKINANSSTTYNPLVQEIVMQSFIDPTQTMRITMGQKWTSSNSLSLQQAIFNQSVFIGLKAAKSTREFYIINADLTEEQIIEKVANAYYQVYQSQQMLENLDDNLNIAEQTIKIIKGLYDAGLAKKIDYDRTVVALNNIKANRSQLLNAIELSENALKFIIGMPIEQQISLPSSTFDAQLYNTTANLSERTEIKVLNKQLELLDWQKKATEAAFYPTATLSGNYTWYGQGEKFPWWNGKKNGVYWSDIASISLNINIPIFNGFAIKSQVEQTKISIEKAQLDLKDTQLALEMAYQNAVTQLDNSSIAIGTQEANVKLANEVLENTRNNYKFGLATLNDILDAERDLADAKNNLTKSKLDYKLAEIGLLKSQGKLRTLSN